LNTPPIRYVSTRGGMPPARFTEILLEGLAPDGGLTVPEAYPRIDRGTLAAWRPLGYRDLAFAILAPFIDDIAPADLRAIIERTYSAQAFGSEEITPVNTLEPGIHLLGLSNGPTLAFKDIAMQLLGNLFEQALARRGETLNILGATSGDTGSAAEYAMRGKRGIRVFMLSPLGKMSRFQTAQMYALDDPHVFNIAVRGVFDDCQHLVKGVSADADFKGRFRIGTVNSINWARLVAQTVYYFKAYFAVTASDDEQVSFAVPSGNFGNACAGHVARMMGLPIRKLIIATNENDVLDEFFRTGCYRVRPADQVAQTSSPSMDISNASNFERFMFDLVGRDPEVIRDLWRRLAGTGEFDLAGTPYFARVAKLGFVSARSTHADRLATIRDLERGYGAIIDPHTADGVKAGLAYREPGVPLVCLETALPVKFEATIREALGRAPMRPPGLENIESLPQRYDVIDPDLDGVKAYIARHAVT
jgi:threonine synthase